MAETPVGPRITYATISSGDFGAVHGAMDEALPRVRSEVLGREYPMYIDGEAVRAEESFQNGSPIDTRIVVGRFQEGNADHARAAVAAAKRAFPAWSARPWEERVEVIHRLAAGIRRDQIELSLLMGFETGKNRLECLGDVVESADFLDYYADQMTQNGGFVRPMESEAPGEENVSVLRPYGVWAVISPFNFPMALATGPTGAALLTGNTVVLKPASDTPVLALRLAELAAEAGVPAGAFNVVTGGGRAVGQPLAEHPDVSGIVFTGSKEVGMGLYNSAGANGVPRPVVAEMGGKNPALIMASADVERAATGVYRSAFGAQGQKCSACSRVYVAAEIYDDFVKALVERTREIRAGNPVERDVWLGPVINQGAVDTFLEGVERARASGGRILAGGGRMTAEPFSNGYYVEPTIVDGLPLDHSLFRDELFVPLVVVGKVDSFEQAMERANDTEYGLTAGIFSQDDDEIGRFFDGIDAGVVYANRVAGATTGAWPGVNPFGGWKTSGTTGRGAGGPHYIQQFLREQSRVRIR